MDGLVYKLYGLVDLSSGYGIVKGPPWVGVNPSKKPNIKVRP
jgi:hypothetical protein